MTRHPPAGTSLLELLAVLTLMGVMLASAAPSLSATLDRYRCRAAIDRLASDLAYARALAVRGGRRIQLRFSPATGCAASYSLVRSDGAVLRTVHVAGTDGRLCLSGNVPHAMSVDGRGMLVGSARTLHARAGTQADSAVVSILGRVLRAPR